MSRYKVYTTPRALKETKDLPGHIRQRVKRAVKALADNPRPSGSQDLDVPDLEHEVRRLKRGNAYFISGKYDLAIADHDQAIKLKPDLAVAYHNRGNAYFTKGEYDRAIADFDQAIKLMSNLAGAYYSRGLAYAQKGDYVRALADLRRYLELSPNAADRKTVEEMILKFESQK